MKKILVICFITNLINAGDITELINILEKKRTAELEQQEQEFAQAIVESPGYTFAHSNLAKVLLDLKRPHEAAWAAEKALELDALNFDARLYLGIAYRRTEQREKAIKMLQQVITSDHLTTDHLPTNHRTLACHQVAMAHSDLHELDDAILYYSKAMALDSTFLSPASNLAFIHYNRGEYHKAKDIFVRYITKNPHAAHGPFAYALMIKQLENKNKENLQELGPIEQEFEETQDQRTYHANIQLTIKRLHEIPRSMPDKQLLEQLRFISMNHDHIPLPLGQAIAMLIETRRPELLTDSSAK